MIVDVAPMVMRHIRREMRRRANGLSVPQFRALLYVYRHEAAGLAEIAEHVGLMPPSASKMMDKLVARGLVLREIPSDDRRRIRLTLTARGRASVELARRGTAEELAHVVAKLTPEQRVVLAQGLNILSELFSEHPPARLPHA